MSHRIVSSLALATLTFAAVTLVAPAALASGAAPAGTPDYNRQQVLKPAKLYDGSTPIDRSHGMLGSNGTYGLRNPEMEARKDAAISAPGIFAAPYPYSEKNQFVHAVADRLRFFEEAVINLEERGTMVTPETNAFSDAAMPKLRDLLARAREAHGKAKSAGEKDWAGAEQAAHTSLVELKTTYEAMMRDPAAAPVKVK